MEIQKAILTAFRRSGAKTGTAPFAMTARRFFGLDVRDWSVLLLGLALVGLLLALV